MSYLLTFLYHYNKTCEFKLYFYFIVIVDVLFFRFTDESDECGPSSRRQSRRHKMGRMNYERSRPYKLPSEHRSVTSNQESSSEDEYHSSSISSPLQEQNVR